MRGPSLQKTALLSFALHLTVFIIAFLILRQSSRLVLPPPYTVNLVSPDVLTGSERGTMIDAGRESKETKESREPAAPAEIPKKSKKEAAKEKELVERKIAALQQREKVENKISDLAAKQRRIDTLARLRSIIAIKARAGNRDRSSKIPAPNASSHIQSDNYQTKITEEIHSYWTLPPGMANKELEAIVSVRILKDGTVVIQGIEKKSGNLLFDRSAVAALNKVRRVSPPPYEMEIGVRFYP